MADGAEDPDHGASFYIKPVDSYGYGMNNMARIQDQGIIVLPLCSLVFHAQHRLNMRY